MKKRLNFGQIIEAIQSKREEIEDDVTDTLRPIREKLDETDYRIFRSTMFGCCYPSGWDLTIGYNGKNTYTLGQRFHFEVKNTNQIICGDFESDTIETLDELDFAIECLEMELSRKAYNYYADKMKGAERLLKTLHPLEWYRQYAQA
jgi:hypothetical protein